MSIKNIKTKLINTTFEMLKTMSPEEIKARAVAKEVGCTATAIYNHFSGMDHLISIACVKFLEDYIKEFVDMFNNEYDIPAQATKAWTIFLKHAFSNVEVFQRLYNSEYTDEVSELVLEYFDLFPENWKAANSFYSAIFLDTNLEKRNWLMLKRLAAMGHIQAKDVDVINSIECYTFFGLLSTYRSCFREEGKPEEAIQKFMRVMEYTHGFYGSKKRE